MELLLIERGIIGIRYAHGFSKFCFRFDLLTFTFEGVTKTLWVLKIVHKLRRSYAVLKEEIKKIKYFCYHKISNISRYLFNHSHKK